MKTSKVTEYVTEKVAKSEIGGQVREIASYLDSNTDIGLRRQNKIKHLTLETTFKDADGNTILITTTNATTKKYIPLADKTYYPVKYAFDYYQPTSYMLPPHIKETRAGLAELSDM